MLFSESENYSVLYDLCNPMDYTVHGILQATILDWVAFPFSRGSSQPRGRTKPFPSSGDFPNLEVKPRSPTLQADSFPAEPHFFYCTINAHFNSVK